MANKNESLNKELIAIKVGTQLINRFLGIGIEKFVAFLEELFVDIEETTKVSITIGGGYPVRLGNAALQLMYQACQEEGCINGGVLFRALGKEAVFKEKVDKSVFATPALEHEATTFKFDADSIAMVLSEFELEIEPDFVQDCLDQFNQDQNFELFLHRMGLEGTRSNARRLLSELRRVLEGKKDIFGRILVEPKDIAEYLSSPHAQVAVMGGTAPGQTTDAAMAELATQAAEDDYLVTMVMITLQLHDDDPRTNPDAQPITDTTFEELLELGVIHRAQPGETTKPGGNYAIDPVAVDKLMALKEKGNLVKIIIGRMNGEGGTFTVQKPDDMSTQDFNAWQASNLPLMKAIRGETAVTGVTTIWPVKGGVA